MTAKVLNSKKLTLKVLQNKDLADLTRRAVNNAEKIYESIDSKNVASHIAFKVLKINELIDKVLANKDLAATLRW